MKCRLCEVVHHRVDALFPAALDVMHHRRRPPAWLVLTPCLVIAGANVDVGGHVHQVARGRRHRRQFAGGSESAFGDCATPQRRECSSASRPCALDRASTPTPKLPRFSAPSSGVPSTCHRPHGCSFMPASAKSVAASRSSRKFFSDLAHCIAIVFGGLVSGLLFGSSGNASPWPRYRPAHWPECWRRDRQLFGWPHAPALKRSSLAGSL